MDGQRGGIRAFLPDAPDGVTLVLFGNGTECEPTPPCIG